MCGGLWPPYIISSEPCMSDEVRHLRLDIDRLVAPLSAAPADLATHQQLRQAAFRYVAAGGRGLGLWQRLRPPPRDAAARVVWAARRWAFSPGNVGVGADLLRAVAAYGSRPGRQDVTAVHEWLVRTLVAARGKV
jgi:hypothetical protein